MDSRSFLLLLSYLLLAQQNIQKDIVQNQNVQNHEYKKENTFRIKKVINEKVFSIKNYSKFRKFLERVYENNIFC